jgi:hypothetical protein
VEVVAVVAADVVGLGAGPGILATVGWESGLDLKSDKETYAVGAFWPRVEYYVLVALFSMACSCLLLPSAAL